MSRPYFSMRRQLAVSLTSAICSTDALVVRIFLKSSRARSAGSRAADCGHFADGIVEIAIRIARPVEFGADDGIAVVAGRNDLFDVLQPLHQLLNRLGDGLLHLLGIGTGLDAVMTTTAAGNADQPRAGSR
jgi:hypothetical protein